MATAAAAHELDEREPAIDDQPVYDPIREVDPTDDGTAVLVEHTHGLHTVQRSCQAIDQVPFVLCDRPGRPARRQFDLLSVERIEEHESTVRSRRQEPATRSVLRATIQLQPEDAFRHLGRLGTRCGLEGAQEHEQQGERAHG